jgi:hypothetical protein
MRSECLQVEMARERVKGRGAKMSLIGFVLATGAPV